MNVFKFNGVKVRYYWYTDHQLCFMANSAFRSFGYKGWWNYMQRHPEDFFQVQLHMETSQYDYTWAISWDNLKKFRDNVLSSGTRINNWWLKNQGIYNGFMQYVEENILHKNVNAKPKAQVAQPVAKPQAQPVAQPVAPLVDLDSPAHKHPATVAALQSLPKAKLPEPEPLTLDDYCAQVKPVPMSVTPPTAKPRQCPSAVEALFDKVTAALTRGGKEEDTFPRLAPKWGCSEEECALRMAEMKIARIETGKEKEDSYVDAIGYMVLAYNKFKENQNG